MPLNHWWAALWLRFQGMLTHLLCRAAAGTLCYWATSSSLALAQNHALKLPAVRRAVGLPVGPPPAPPAAPRAGEAPGARAPTLPELVAGSVDPPLARFLRGNHDAYTLFRRAAELRADGRIHAAMAVLVRLLEGEPAHPRAHFALGQLHALLRDWPGSEQHYLAAARAPGEGGQAAARAWYGAGVALHMQGERETAADAFQRAGEEAEVGGQPLILHACTTAS